MAGTLRPFKLTAMGHTIVTVSLLLLLVMACSMNGQHSAVAFSEESMKDLSRLPHFQRHWLQRVDQQAITKLNLNAKLTTALSSNTTTTTTTTATLIETTDDSLEEVTEKDERVTTTGPSLVNGRQADAGMDRSTPTLTISEAKERLKARKIKSRKIKTAVMQQKEEDDGHYYYKKAETHLRDEKEEAVEVKKHIQRMVNASCSIPAPRLVYVRQQHEASPNVRYLPACTWLHRCSDEVGCCTDDSKTCSASHIESVSLPFFVLTMTGTETKRTMTRLSFENHTACECVGRNSDVMPRTEPYSIADEPGHRPSSSTLHDGTNSSDEGKKHHHENSKKSKGVQQLRRHDSGRGYHLGRVATARLPAPLLLLQQRDQDILTEATSDSSYPVVAKRRLSDAPFQTSSFNYSSVNQCRCPSGYTPVGNGNRKRTTCSMCQCYDGDNKHHRHRHHNNNRAKWSSSSERITRQPLLIRCGRLKRGLDSFSARDTGCIVEKKCGTPECDYGRYLEWAGRCPRRNELQPTSVSG